MADGELAANVRGAGTQLIQSRRISVEEALAIFRADIAGYRRQLATRPSYRIGSRASHLVLPLACIIPVAAGKLPWFSHVSPYLIAAVVCLAVIGIRHAWRWYCHRLYAEICHDACNSDRRLHIEENGIVATENGVAASISWNAISDIVVDKSWLMICFSQGIPFCLPKAAFENQNVDGFCAELVRRWNRAKTGSAAEVIA